MAKFTVTHSINCNADKCAKLYFDQAFNEALYKQELGYSAFAVTSRSESDTQIVCNYTGKKLGPGSLPGPVTKVMGDSSYKEDVTFDLDFEQIYLFSRQLHEYQVVEKSMISTSTLVYLEN